ncbi:hypothetical protein MTO96_050969 [Rhipicephalus appendiculatus]
MQRARAQAVYQRLFFTSRGASARSIRKYVVSCDSVPALPDISFRIQKRDFVIKPKDYVLQLPQDNTTECLSGFQAMDLPEATEPMWILGDSFIRRYYTIFDRPGQRPCWFR